MGSGNISVFGMLKLARLVYHTPCPAPSDWFPYPTTKAVTVQELLGGDPKSGKFQKHKSFPIYVNWKKIQGDSMFPIVSRQIIATKPPVGHSKSGLVRKSPQKCL